MTFLTATVHLLGYAKYNWWEIKFLHQILPDKFLVVQRVGRFPSKDVDATSIDIQGDCAIDPFLGFINAMPSEFTLGAVPETCNFQCKTHYMLGPYDDQLKSQIVQPCQQNSMFPHLCTPGRKTSEINLA